MMAAGRPSSATKNVEKVCLQCANEPLLHVKEEQDRALRNREMELDRIKLEMQKQKEEMRRLEQQREREEMRNYYEQELQRSASKRQEERVNKTRENLEFVSNIDEQNRKARELAQLAQISRMENLNQYRNDLDHQFLESSAKKNQFRNEEIQLELRSSGLKFDEPRTDLKGPWMSTIQKQLAEHEAQRTAHKNEVKQDRQAIDNNVSELRELEAKSRQEDFKRRQERTSEIKADSANRIQRQSAEKERIDTEKRRERESLREALRLERELQILNKNVRKLSSLALSTIFCR